MALGRDPALEFGRNLIDRFIQFKGIQFQQELLKRREDRYSTQLSENRLHRQRQLSISQEHLGLAKRREERFAGQPRDNTVEYYTSRGYSPEQAKRLLDIRLGASPKPRRPIEDIRDARIIMENALSDQEYGVGEEMLRDAMERLASQKTDVSDDISPSIFGGGESQTTPETGVFQRTQPSKPAIRGGFLGRKESAFPAGFETPEGLESIWEQLSGEEKTTARTYIEGGGTPQEIIDAIESNRQLE